METALELLEGTVDRARLVVPSASSLCAVARLKHPGPTVLSGWWTVLFVVLVQPQHNGTMANDHEVANHQFLRCVRSYPYCVNSLGFYIHTAPILVLVVMSKSFNFSLYNFS